MLSCIKTSITCDQDFQEVNILFITHDLIIFLFIQFLKSLFVCRFTYSTKFMNYRQHNFFFYSFDFLFVFLQISMTNLRLLKSQIRFEVFNLLKASRSSARNAKTATPRRFAKFLIDQHSYHHFKSFFKIKGIYSQSDLFLNTIGLKGVKRFTTRNTQSSTNQIGCRFKTYFAPVESSWRFMVRKRTIEVEFKSGCREKITKFVLSIKFVCESYTISLN